MSNSNHASRSLLCGVGILVGIAAVAACSATDRNIREEKDQFGDAAAPPEDAGQCPIHCSRDLKQVLEGCPGSERVVQQCNQDQGCGGEMCVDACIAAQTQRGSAGCEFMTLPPDDATGVNGACFAALVANTWDRPVSISAEYDGKPLDISGAMYTVDRKSAASSEEYTLLTGPLPPGQVAVVLLSDQSPTQDAPGSQVVHCPPGTKAALDFDPIRHGTVITTAFRIKTDAPVAAYASYPYGGELGKYPTATLLLPLSTWEKDYIAVSPFDFPFDFWVQVPNHRWLQIVAAEDGTEVTIRPNADIGASPETAAAYQGEAQTYKLSRGQVFQIMQPGANLTGSPISANKPIGLFGGASATFLSATAADVLGQQGYAATDSVEDADVVVLNTWYAACPPCRAEAPDLVALAEDYADDGVQLLGINSTDAPGAAQPFERNFEIPYPSVHDTDGAAIAALSGVVPVNAVPTTVVLDRTGHVAARIIGQVDPSTLRALVDEALAEPA